MSAFHAVRFYDSSESIASIVAAFLGAGWVTHQPALVIANPERQRAITHALRSINFSVESLRRSRNLCVLDTEETLRQLIVNGAPDPVRFESVAGAALARIGTADTRAFRVYDEMADALWKKGARDASLRLEMLWDDVSLTRNCSVVCGHGVEDLDAGSAPRSLCTHHTHVLGPNGLPHPVSRF